MAYTRTFEGFAPPSRYDGLPFTAALIRESDAEDGTYSTIDTITLDPVDTDPSSPQSRNFTTDAATVAEGWYIIRWQAEAGDIYDSDPIFYSAAGPASAYAEVADVSELNTARTFTASSNPDITQVSDWLDQTAGVLDGILRESGYALPIPATATQTLKLLEHYNALGAAAMVEQGAPTSDRRKEALALWEEAQKMLREGTIVLDAPRDDDISSIRAPAYATPMFTRDMAL